MNVRDSLLAFDTNEYVFALRRHGEYSACIQLFDVWLPHRRIYLPLRVLQEMQNNLSAQEMSTAFTKLQQAHEFAPDFSSPSLRKPPLFAGNPKPAV